MITRHPSPALLAIYASGELALAAGLSVAAHLERCPACRAKTTELEEVEGAQLAASPAAELAHGALAKALARLDEHHPDAPASPRSRLGDVDLPGVVGHLGLTSRRWIGPGFWAARVKAPPTNGWRTYLLRAPAGAHIPHHAHRGTELICVLSGSFRDGVAYHEGDFAEHVAGSEHDLTVSRTEPCACLMSMQGQTRWHGWSKVIRPVLGM